MKLSACLEWLFAAEAPRFEDRIASAAAAGFEGVEFWRWSNKDIDAVEAAAIQSGIKIAGIVAEPMIPLTDSANQAAFLDGLEQSIAVARRLGAGVLITQAGSALTDRSRQAQTSALVDTLKHSADRLGGTGIKIGVEPLNTIVDHAGYFLSSTTEALDIIDGVDRPEIALVYDIYHSMVMVERPQTVLQDRLDRIAHVHIADHPGRNEPGTGTLPLREVVEWLIAQGYDGWLGLEYRPQSSTLESFARTRQQLLG